VVLSIVDNFTRECLELETDVAEVRPCQSLKDHGRKMKNGSRRNSSEFFESAWQFIRVVISMTPNKLDFDAVRKIALSLPDVEESTTYGSPALKVRGKLLACIAIHRSAEPESLAVRVGFDARMELIAAAPDIYYVTDHYLNYPVVLVRLSRIRHDTLRDLLGMAWHFVTMKTLGSKRSVRKQKASTGGVNTLLKTKWPKR
jgi:hypothetical protein